MAKRGVFVTKEEYPYFEEIQVEFDWFGGFAKSQKQKCILSLHTNFLASMPEKKILEISSSSTDKLGNQLSAMHLKKFVPSYNKYFCLESVFQTARIYENGEGPFYEDTLFGQKYIELNGFECKKIVKQRSQESHSYRYLYEDFIFPAPDFHISLFYDYIYLNSLLEDANIDVKETLIASGYDAFTDMATKSLNNQARSCAIFMSLYRLGLLDKIKTIEDYMKLFRVNMNAERFAYNNSYENVQLLNNKSEYSPAKQLSKIYSSEKIIEIYNDKNGIPNLPKENLKYELTNPESSNSNLVKALLLSSNLATKPKVVTIELTEKAISTILNSSNYTLMKLSNYDLNSILIIGDTVTDNYNNYLTYLTGTLVKGANALIVDYVVPSLNNVTERKYSLFDILVSLNSDKIKFMSKLLKVKFD